MTWSPFSATSIEDPGSGHKWLLRECPVHRCEEFDPPFYTLSRYADVESALRNIELFSSQYGQGPRFSEPVGMLCDPPQHTHLRSIVQSAFSPRKMLALQAITQQITTQLMDEIMARGHEFDVHDDLAFPVPVTIIAGLLGVADQDLDKFKYWSDIQVAAMGASDPTQYAQDQADFSAYLTRQLRDRTRALTAAEPVPDDLLTLVASARMEDGSPISETNALSMLSQLLVGGNETTTSLITNLIWRLLEQPELWQELRANPTLVESAIEESLRFDPPVLGLYRNTTRAAQLHGVEIPAGSKVWINYAAANRDPEVFVEPDRFRLDRPKKRHMSFGLGTHFCLGAPMARLEAQVVLSTMLERMPDLTLLGEGERTTPFFLWGRRHLPVRRQ